MQYRGNVCVNTESNAEENQLQQLAPTPAQFSTGYPSVPKEKHSTTLRNLLHQTSAIHNFQTPSYSLLIDRQCSPALCSKQGWRFQRDPQLSSFCFQAVRLHSKISKTSSDLNEMSLCPVSFSMAHCPRFYIPYFSHATFHLRLYVLYVCSRQTAMQ